MVTFSFNELMFLSKVTLTHLQKKLNLTEFFLTALVNDFIPFEFKITKNTTNESLFKNILRPTAANHMKCFVTQTWEDQVNLSKKLYCRSLDKPKDINGLNLNSILMEILCLLNNQKGFFYLLVVFNYNRI